MSAIFLACAEVLMATSQLGQGGISQSPDQLRSELLDQLRRLVETCRALEVSDEDTAEARYAVVAFMDDRILKAHWSGRTEWANNPLQLELYQENSAGEGFYARLHALLVRAETAAALEIYYLCLALGFTGASRGGADAEQQMKAVAKRLPSLPLSEPIGPNALAKDHRPLQVLPRTLFGFVAILAVVALLVSEGLMVVSMYSAIREAQSLLQSSGFVGLAGGLRP